MIWFSAFVLIITSTSVLSQEARSKDSASDSWKTDVENGVSIIGKAAEFAAVGTTHHFAVSPDGRTLAFSTDAGVKLWDLNKKKITNTFEAGPSYLVEFSPDGRYAASLFYASGAKIRVWDAIDWSELADLELDESGSFPQGFSFFPDGKRIAVSLNNKLVIWDTESGQKVREINETGYFRKFAFLDDGEKIMLPGGKVFDAETGAKIETNRALKKFSQAVTSHGKYLAGASWNHGVALYDVQRGASLELEHEKAKNFLNVEFSDDGKYLAATTFGTFDSSTKQQIGSTLIVWDIQSRKPISQFKVDAMYVQKFKFSADGRFVFVMIPGETGVSALDLSRTDSDSDMPGGLKGPARVVAFSPAGKRIAAGTPAGSVVIFNGRTGVPEKRIGAMAGRPVTYLGFSSDGKRLFCSANYQLISIYDVEADFKLVESLDMGYTNDVSLVQRFGGFMSGKRQERRAMMIADVRFSDNDKQLMAIAVAPAMQYRIATWATKSGKQEFRKNYKHSRYRLTNDATANQSNGFYPEAISPDGRLFVIAQPGMLMVADRESGDVFHEIENPDPPNECLFSPNSKQLIAISQSGFKVWDLRSNEEIESGQLPEIRHAAYSLDGKRLAVLHGDSNTVSLFETKDWQKIFTKRSKEKPNKCLAISEKGDQVAIGLRDGRVEVWDLEKLVK